MKAGDANLIARLILEGFIDYRQQFKAITRQAPGYFAAADWHALQCLSVERIDRYEEMIDGISEKIVSLSNDGIPKPELWLLIKECYTEVLNQRSDAELGETFYNSIYCKLMQHSNISDRHMFIQSKKPKVEAYRGEQIFRRYALNEGVPSFLKKLFEDYNFSIPWENKRRDSRNLMRYIRNTIPDDVVAGEGTVIEVIRSVFYRNKAAYIVGRVQFDHQSVPFVLPVLNTEGAGVYIDTALSDENDVSVVFSFTRAYFLVDVDIPAEFIRFLHSLIPMKSIAELYNSLGFYKQGKAEFYRDFMDHLDTSTDQFEIAEGTKGMVMTVFTLPSYPVVFKVIKDRFSSSKNITRGGVIDKYQLVKRHDRAGRMADTQEFVNLVLPRKRLSAELLCELMSVACSSIILSEDDLTISHMWTERRMIPLNIYLNEMLSKNDEESVYLAINEFGKCIKELAAANIFAGDMLFKNFGVTRHNRVVFYDYDEILYLTDCNFRDIPEPMYPEQELASEPWYSVAEQDVFPEEFKILTACDSRIRVIFNELHGDLLTLSWWINIQQKVASGALLDLYPYRRIVRFPRAP